MYIEAISDNDSMLDLARLSDTNKDGKTDFNEFINYVQCDSIIHRHTVRAIHSPDTIKTDEKIFPAKPKILSEKIQKILKIDSMYYIHVRTKLSFFFPSPFRENESSLFPPINLFF